MKIWVLSFIVLAGLCGIAGFVFRSGSSAPSKPSVSELSANSRIVLFVDQSDSIRPGQKDRWMKIGEEFLTHVHCGDKLSVYAIHDHTGDGGALFSADLPAIHARPTSDQLRNCKAALSKARSSARQTLQSVLQTATPSHQTDIFSVFDRCCGGDSDGRSTLVFIFSDMLHVTRTMNMEAQTLHDEQFAATISELACRHRWNAHTLSGVSVFAVLPAIERNDTYRVANDRLVLQRFYKLLVESLGGRLVRFDTDLSTGDLLR